MKSARVAALTEERLLHDEQGFVRRTVRIVAVEAVFAHGRMFEEERAALFRMALEARLFVNERLVHHAGTGGHTPGRCEGAVRIMAIGAGHEPFVNAMLEGHGELAANVGVAAVTEVGLTLGQKKFRDR